MRKFYLILCLLLSFAVKAELHIDIDAGTVKPISIAVIDFDSKNKSLNNMGKTIASIIQNNLKSSGLFSIVPKDSFIDTKQPVNQIPKFENWSVINTQALLYGEITNTKNDKVKVEFHLWDIASKKRIYSQALVSEKSNIRRIGHIISDYIYQKMTGDKGYFDTRIVYVAETGSKLNRTKRLAIIDQDGANLKYLTDGKIQTTTPVFSNNSQKIAYVTYFNNIPRVYIFDIETGKQELLGNFPGMSFAPRFSPDDKSVIMSIANDGNSDIYEMDLNTKELKRLTTNRAIETSPTFSPDGKKIAFISDRSGTPNIYVGDRKGKNNEQRISFESGIYGDVVWSPRGDYLAFVKIKNNKFYIGVMFEDGTGERLIADGYMVESPTWSPNGRRIIYYEQVPQSNGEDKLFIKSIDVSGYTKSTMKLPTLASDPAWSPLLP